MLPAVAAAARFLRFLSLALVLGASTLPLLFPAGSHRTIEGLTPRRRLVAASVVALAAGLVELAARSAELLDLASGTGSPWWALVAHTRVGRVWLAEQTAVLCLLAVLVIRSGAPGPTRLTSALVGATAAAALLLGPLASHSAGLDDPARAIVVHALHLGAVALWVGGVLTLGLLSRALRASAPSEDAARADEARQLLASFSRVAPLLVSVAVASGIGLATWHVASWPRLLATPDGGLLLGKLLLLGAALMAAARLRWRWLRARERSGAVTWRAVRRNLAVEGAFAALAMLLAASMAETTPAAHDVVSWWLPFRFSIQATWSLPGVAGRAIAAAVVLAVYAGVAIGRLRRRDLRRGGTVAAAGAAFAAALALPPIAVKAYPGTYWTPAVAYDAVSVASGRSLFRNHCVSCHGLAGRGDGPLATTLPKRPANLTEPHTADHTAGDMFWWLTYGIPESGMQPFDLLPVDQRWDLINFLRAFAAGYQARILGPGVSPERPWLPAVDFAFTTTTGETGLLRDLRDRAAVLLVFFSAGASDARLAELGKNEGALRATGAEILAVPIRPVEGDLAPLRTVRTVAAEAPGVVATYALFRRTFADPGNETDDDLPAHLELLIDRFGYLRARWRPDQGGRGWNDLAFLGEQIRILAAEPRLLPPPDDHVH